MVEIAMTAVNLGKKDKGILYKFVYEVIPPRHMRQNPALISSLTSSVPVTQFVRSNLAASTVAEVNPPDHQNPAQPNGLINLHQGYGNVLVEKHYLTESLKLALK